MDKLPITVMIFYSIPESFLVCWLGLSLINIRPDLKRLFMVAVMGAVFSLLVRSLPFAYGVHTLLDLVFLITMLSVIIGIKLRYSVLGILLGVLVLAIVETVNMPVFRRVTGYEMPVIMASPSLRILLGIPQLLVLAAAIGVVNRFNLRVISAKSGKSSGTGGAGDWEHRRILLLYSLIGIILLQVMLVVFISNEGNLIKVFPLVSVGLIKNIVAVLMILVALISLKIVIRLLLLTEELAQYQGDIDNWKNVNELFASMRAQRHDFLNHVQTLYGMLQLGCFPEAKEYMREVFQDTVALNNVVISGNPSLSALLHVKSGVAAARGIDFQITVECDLARLRIPSHDLNRVLGNLIDNAFDAVENVEPPRRRVRLSARERAGELVFEIENPGTLDPAIKEHIFDRGVSTKKGSHMGMGLSIVRQLARKHGGEVTVDDSGAGTVIGQITLPV